MDKVELSTTAKLIVQRENLVVAKGYLTKLRANDIVKSYIDRRKPEILGQFELVANTVSMEAAVQQQQSADGTAAELSPDAVRVNNDNNNATKVQDAHAE